MKVIKRLVPFAAIAAVAVLLLYLPDLVPERYADLQSYFATERQRQGLIGFTAASVRYGKPDFAGAWGTDARGLPLDVYTPMALGRMSTAVTGFLAARAVSEGLLDPGRPLAELLPELHSRGPAGAGEGPTLRDFLSQRSGWGNRDLDDRHPGATSLVASVEALGEARPSRQPGGDFQYLETNYEAVGLALERSWGMPFARLASEKLFGPLKMVQSDATGGQAAHRLAQGSSTFFWTAVPHALELPEARVPASGIVSTAPDMARLIAALLTPGFGGVDLLGKTGTSRLYRPLGQEGDWTYGWEIRSTEDGIELRLQSGTDAFSAVAALWPERKAGIVILAPVESAITSEFVLPSLLDGAKEILLRDSTEPPPPFGRLPILLAVTAFIHLLSLAASTGSALSWARAAQGRADAAGDPRGPLLARVRCMVGIGIRVFLLLGTPGLASLFLGAGTSWSLLLEGEPGLAGWFCAALIIGTFRNAARLSWIRNPSSQAGKMKLLLKR